VLFIGFAAEGYTHQVYYRQAVTGVNPVTSDASLWPAPAGPHVLAGIFRYPRAAQANSFAQPRTARSFQNPR
jgi:hypothetical protein